MIIVLKETLSNDYSIQKLPFDKHEKIKKKSKYGGKIFKDILNFKNNKCHGF